MPSSYEDETDISDSELDNYINTYYEEIGKSVVVEVSDGLYRCPYCTGKKWRKHGLKDLLQHSTALGNSDCKGLKIKAKHLGLTRFLKNKLEENGTAVESSNEANEIPDGQDLNGSFVWPCFGIVANLPVKWQNGTKLKDELNRKGFNVTRVIPMWSYKGHLGKAIVAFIRGWPGFISAMMFEKSFEAGKRGKNHYEESHLDEGLFGWVARGDDYHSDGVVGDHLRKHGDLKTLSKVEDEESKKNTKLVSYLTGIIEDKKIKIQELEEELWSLREIKVLKETTARGTVEHKKADEHVMRLAEDQKRQKEEPHQIVIEPEKKLNAKKALELVNPVQVNTGIVDELVANKSITQHVELVPPLEKRRRLEQILRSQEPGSRIIIFCSTKTMCDQLAYYLTHPFRAASIHGDKSQGERDHVLSHFRTGKSPVLVATDVAARGLDVKDIRVVVNYDFPTGIEDYVHRIGKTGRAGATGEVYTFLGDNDAKHASDLVKLLEGANQRVPAEIRNMASRGGGIGGKFTRWGSGPSSGGYSFGGRDGGGRGGRNASSYGGRGGGRVSDRDSDRYDLKTNASGSYHAKSFHEPMISAGGSGARRSRKPPPTKASGWGGSSRDRSRRSPTRFDRGGRGGRNDSSYGGRGGGRDSDRDSDRYDRDTNASGSYHAKSFHEPMISSGGGGARRSRNPPPTKASVWGGSSRDRSRSRSPTRFDRGGRGGRNDSSYGGRGGGRDSDRDSDRYDRDTNASGSYHAKSFHEPMISAGGGGASRSRNPPPTKASVWGGSSRDRSRSRSPTRFDRAPPARDCSPSRRFHQAMMERKI